MPNTSATGGYLNPAASPTPLEDDALADFLQVWIVGITGMVGSLVRPLWQPEATNIPVDGTDWLAFGVTEQVADTFVAIVHNGYGDGIDQLRRHEVLHCRCSFYGPNAMSNASIFRDGMQVQENHAVLSAVGMGLVESGSLTQIPELLKMKWYKRIDFTFKIRRQVVREYSVLNLLSGNGTLNNEIYIETIKTP